MRSIQMLLRLSVMPLLLSARCSLRLATALVELAGLPFTTIGSPTLTPSAISRVSWSRDTVSPTGPGVCSAPAPPPSPPPASSPPPPPPPPPLLARASIRALSASAASSCLRRAVSIAAFLAAASFSRLRLDTLARARAARPLPPNAPPASFMPSSRACDRERGHER